MLPINDLGSDSPLYFSLLEHPCTHDLKLITSHTILRWTQLGLVTIAALDNHGFNLYQPGQPHPTRDQITAACRPPGTGDAITGGQLAARHGVSRSAVYKWHQRGLIRSL